MRIGGDRLARQALRALQTGQAGRFPEHILGQHGTGGGGKRGRRVGGLAHPRRLLEIATRIDGKNLVIRCRPRRQRHQQQSQ